jgi:hypothetical protein
VDGKEAIKMNDHDKQVTSRTFDEEREYLEGLLTSRFNFYFVFAGAVAAGATQIESHREQGVIFIAAFVISALFWRPLFRTSDLISKIIKETDAEHNHPLSIARRESNKQCFLGEANTYFGQLIPGVITFLFLAFGIARVAPIDFARLCAN